MLYFKPAIAAIFLVLMSSLSAASGPVSIDHAPLPLQRAQLLVSGPNGEVTYSAEELEGLGFHRITTITPWRDKPAAFDGVLLTDILDANGISEAIAIDVVAENDYVVRIPSEVWKRWPILVATRVNGRAHTRRQRGPIQFILPMSSDREAGMAGNESNWVWMAARIEAVYE